jgi:hypothetical protein
MKRVIRLALLACAIVTALAFGGNAFASYTPRLVVTSNPLTPQGGAKTDVAVQFGQNDDATARVVIYVPQGYNGTLGAAGKQMGTAEATVLTSIAPTQPIPVKGTIVGEDPAQFTAQATQCTGSPSHAGVWTLRLEAAGQQLTVPVYIDEVTDPAEANLGKFKLTVCLPSPYIPQSAGGAALGAKLVTATLHLNDVFALPAQNGSYGWTVIATPYTVNTAAVNPAGTVQARAFVRLPVLLSLTAKYLAKKNTYQLAGKLTENLAGLGGFKVTIYRGSSASKLKRVANVTTKVRGVFSTAGHLSPRKTTYFQARVTVPVRNTACTGGAPGINCVSATLDPWAAKSRVVKITIAKKK